MIHRLITRYILIDHFDFTFRLVKQQLFLRNTVPPRWTILEIVLWFPCFWWHFMTKFGWSRHIRYFNYINPKFTLLVKILLVHLDEFVKCFLAGRTPLVFRVDQIDLRHHCAHIVFLPQLFIALCWVALLPGIAMELAFEGSRGQQSQLLFINFI